MGHPEGARETCDVRVGFDRRVRLEFHGSKISSDGGVHFPATAGESHSDYSSYFERWTKLQLPYTYGSLNRLFGNNLTRKQLRSFHIAQGLLYLKSHYCFGWHCHVCKVKRSL